MKIITSSQVRANLARKTEQVCEDHAPLIITRRNGEPVVLMSLEDYRSIEEDGLFVEFSGKCTTAERVYR